MHKRKRIAVAVTSIHQKSIVRMLKSLGDEVAARGYELQIFATFSDLYQHSKNDIAQQQIFDIIPFEKISGLIIFSETIKNQEVLLNIAEKSRLHGIPTVSLKYPVPGCFNVSYDSEHALAGIIRHLIEVHHCQKINFITGLKGNDIAERRTDVYRQVLSEYNIPVEDERIAYGDFWDKPARQAMQRFLDSELPFPDAVVCANDSMGIAVCDYLKSKGYKIPEDILVTGLGGIEERDYHLPILTTAIYDPLDTANYILDTLEKLEIQNSEEDLCGKVPSRIVYAESCGCLFERQKIYENQLMNMYTQKERERQFSHATHEFMDIVNAQGTISSLASELPNYLWGPRLNGYNLYLDARFAINCRLTKEKIADRQFMWMNRDTVKDNAFPKILQYSGYDQQENNLFGENHQMMIIPLYVDDIVCGILSFNYNGATLDHECLYELVMTLDNLLNGICNQAKFLRVSQELNKVSEQTILALAEIVEAKSEFTGLHVKRVSEYTRILAETMNYSAEKVDKIRIASMLHDVGKINTPPEILEKPGKLTDEEFNIIKQHVIDGGNMLKNAPGEIMQLAYKIALQHHERWDGKGYLGMKGEEIAQESRIVALADVFDALVSKRPYKRPFSDEEAYDIIVRDSGAHFDPKVVKAFQDNFELIKKIHASYNDERIVV